MRTEQSSTPLNLYAARGLYSPSPKLVTIRISYRICTREDLRGLEWHGLFTHHREIIRAAYRDQQRGTNLMLLAVANEMPVGQVWIDLTKRAGDGAAFLWAVRVIPWLQGLGIGTDLMEYGEQVAAHRGFLAAELGVEKRSVRARRFYERLGYECVGATRESYSYREPNGQRIHRVSHEWAMRKNLSGLPVAARARMPT